MVDVSSTPQTGTCTNVSGTNGYLRSVLKAVSTYRGTSYYYPQRKAIDLFALCLEELGFQVTKDNTTNYYNHLSFDDYGEDVKFQIWNGAASSAYISFLYPRHATGRASVGAQFNNGTSCYSTIRMVGQGAGKTNTVLILGTTAAPALTATNCIYFTEARSLLTGEMKKAVIIQRGSAYYFYPYDADWTFLPGYDSESTAVINLDSYSTSLANSYEYYHDPYHSYKMFEEQSKFPGIPAVSSDGLWEFPSMLMIPYGYIANSSGMMKYQLTAGTIYQIGDKKYLCNANGYQYYLLRVE